MSMPLILVFLTAHACNTLLTISKPLFQTLILAEIVPHLHQQRVSLDSKTATQCPTGSIMSINTTRLRELTKWNQILLNMVQSLAEFMQPMSSMNTKEVSTLSTSISFWSTTRSVSSVTVRPTPVKSTGLAATHGAPTGVKPVSSACRCTPTISASRTIALLVSHLTTPTSPPLPLRSSNEHLSIYIE